MADNLNAEQRHRAMSSVGQRDTTPEIAIRQELHRRGFRYRLHDRHLPGKPDLIFPKWNAVIFVHGCFWHGHECSRFSWPKTRKSFWRKKIQSNRERDAAVRVALQKLGWRIGVVWECSLRGPKQLGIESVGKRCSAWLKGKQQFLELRETGCEVVVDKS